MSQHLGPIVVECDAPPYPIVQASRRIGIRSPEDVRWAHLSRFFLDRHPHGKPAQAGAVRCSCGRPLPDLYEVHFTFDTGGSFSCNLGQCARCRTVFWQEAPHR